MPDADVMWTTATRSFTFWVRSASTRPGTVAGVVIGAIIVVVTGCSNATNAPPKPVQSSVLRQEMATLNRSLHWLEGQGVLVDGFGLSDGSLRVELDRHTASGSDAVLRHRIGSLGVVTVHGAHVAHAF